MNSQDIVVQKASGGIGAELHNVDLGRPLTDAVSTQIRDALTQHGVIFFRDQELTPEAHIALAGVFGPIMKRRYLAGMEGYPEIAFIGKEAGQTKNIGGDWHSDNSWREDPNAASVLVARELPDFGGDTLFANMNLAFETLSEGLKKTLLSLRAVHTNRHVISAEAKARAAASKEAVKDEAIHPVVIRHPGSGKPVLYVNETYTIRFDGWTEKESAPLLNFLYQHGKLPEFQCRFRWAPGSIAVWDNIRVWHYAVNDYPGQRRMMHRITIGGEKLEAFDLGFHKGDARGAAPAAAE